MYATDPVSVRQLRTATLIEAEQSRSGLRPVSHRPSRTRRLFTVLSRRVKRTGSGGPEPSLAPYASHDLFVGLDKRTLARLSDSFVLVDLDAGDSLGRQGEIAPEFVVVLEGRVGVSLDGSPVAVLDSGSHFGSLPLLDDGPTPYQRASFNVLGPCRVALASRLQFADILENYPLVAQRIRAMADVSRAYLLGRADAGAAAEASVEDFPLHIADAV
jgi:hypothetical protein